MLRGMIRTWRDFCVRATANEDASRYARSLFAIGAPSYGAAYADGSLEMLSLPMHVWDPFDRMLIAQGT